MKKQKLLYNDLVRRYVLYVQKLKRLILAGRNEHRQEVLKKHIERLVRKLNGLQVSFTKKVATAGLMAVTTLAVQDVQAQTMFGAPQTNPFGLVNVETFISISLADLDGDGDLDIMSGAFAGNFTYLENTGTVEAPAFGPPQTNPFGLVTIPIVYTSPSFGDLDGDGDLDMISGNNDSTHVYFENTGTVNAPAFEAPQTNPFGLVTAGNNRTKPIFVDLDDDGDLDLMSTEASFAYFENTGTASAPAFGPLQLNPFGFTNLGTSVDGMSLGDLDNDGDFDLIAGAFFGDFFYHENTGDANAPIFESFQINPFDLANIGYRNSPFFGDMDGDGDLDVMSGEFTGNFIYFENVNPLSIEDQEGLDNAITLFPNPATEEVRLSNPQEFVLDQAIVYDLTGRQVQQIDLRGMGTEKIINTSQLSSGTYVVQISGADGKASKLFIKQ